MGTWAKISPKGWAWAGAASGGEDDQEKQGNKSPKAERTGRPCADHVAGPAG